MSKRRRGGQEKQQKGKNRSRPRAWRRGAAAGRRAEPAMTAIARAEERAIEERTRAAVVTAEHRRDVKDWQRLLAGLDRVAPCALAPLPDRLL